MIADLPKLAKQLRQRALDDNHRDMATAALMVEAAELLEHIAPPARESCDRTETIIERSLNCNWITVRDREQLKATLRIALDTEIRAGGPYLDNGWNASSVSRPSSNSEAK